EVYRNDGLGLADASRPTVFRRAEAGSADEALLEGMLKAFLLTGVNPSPGEEETGTAQYGAAYLVAEAIGLDKVRLSFGDTRPNESEEEPTIFPYPGWRRVEMVPQEAVDAIGGEQAGSGICSGALQVSFCCGDFNCSSCDPDNRTSQCTWSWLL